MSGTPVYINVQQLMVDRGRLSLGATHPASASSSAEPHAIIEPVSEAIHDLLTELNTSEALITLAGASHVRIRLTATSIQWLEKTDSQFSKYDLKLTDGKLLFNGNATDPSFKQAFGEKINRLLSAIVARNFQLYTKEEAHGN